MFYLLENETFLTIHQSLQGDPISKKKVFLRMKKDEMFTELFSDVKKYTYFRKLNNFLAKLDF